ncbi:MAG TPA: PrsW family intramembrane metalloprotease [Actinomycetota bacterium]|nr:PrsW family intramembrane metalloprotease [Actinomycetota bacterium]
MASAPASLPRPRWGHRTGLWQWRQPALYLFLLLLLITGYVTVLMQTVFRELSPEGWVLSWFLLLLYAVPVFLLVYFLDLYEREPLSLVFGALLWGAVGATTLAILANNGWAVVLSGFADPEFVAEWGPAILAPWTEEILKAMGVVFIYLIARREVDDVLDGFVYGAMAGLGFAVVEDVFYFMARFGGEAEGVLLGFYVRVIASGLYGHVLYSGLAGMGIAYFTSRRGHASFGRRLGIGVALFLTAMAAHFLWNSPLLNFFPEPPIEGAEFVQVIGATAVKGLPMLAFVVLMVSLAHRREHRWLEAALADEVGKDGLTHEEWSDLQTTRSRRTAVRAMRRRAGPHAGALLKRLHRQQINLAMVRTRVEDPEDPHLVRQRTYVASLRGALQAVPGPGPTT